MPLIAFLITLTILVFFHELGHYYLARKHGVRVNVFSIGFGPALWKKKTSQTEWRLSAIPLGGYVSMHGELALKDDDKSQQKNKDPEALNSKTLWQKTQIVFAGPLANILLALILFWGIFLLQGKPQPGDLLQHGFGQVIADGPAGSAGVLPGDIPLSLNETPIESIAQLAALIQELGAEQPLDLAVSRKGTIMNFAITPEGLDTGGALKIGVTGAIVTQSLGFFESLWQAGLETLYVSQLIFHHVSQLVRGIGYDQVGGPIQIAQIADQALDSGWDKYARFLAMFSINLAILNLLPIPGLDGGYLLSYAITAVFGKRIGDATIKYGLPIGISFLILLMVFVLYSDIDKLFFSH